MNDQSITCCPECDSGRTFIEIPGGRFDSSFGNYLPAEEIVPCERCDGTGEIWPEQLNPDEQPRNYQPIWAGEPL